MDLPEFALSVFQRGSRCGRCRIRFCEHMAVGAGLFFDRKGVSRFGVNVRCPKCRKGYQLLVEGPMDWIGVAVRVIHAVAGRPPAAQKKGKGPPITDREVAEMRRRLSGAKDAAEFLSLFGIDTTRRPADDDPSPAE